MTNEAELIMLGIIPALPTQDPRGEVVVTKKPNGEIVAVTRQDDDGNILSVIAERGEVPQSVANELVYQWRFTDSTAWLDCTEGEFKAYQQQNNLRVRQLQTVSPTASAASAPPMRLIGESHQEQGVVWAGPNPHAWPVGTKFYACPPKAPDEVQ